MADPTPSTFLGCVPHAPFMMLQDRELNRPFWDAYEQQARALLNSFLQSDRFSNAKLAYVQEDQAQAGRGDQQLYTFRIQFTYHGE